MTHGMTWSDMAWHCIALNWSALYWIGFHCVSFYYITLRLFKKNTVHYLIAFLGFGDRRAQRCRVVRLRGSRAARSGARVGGRGEGMAAVPRR